MRWAMKSSVERLDDVLTALTQDGSFPLEKTWGRRELRPHFTKTGRSEKKLQAQLNRARATGTDDGVGSGDIWSSATATKASGRGIVKTEAILSAVWIGKVRMVENVEELRPELGVEPFPEMPILGQGEVQVAEARIGEHVAAHVAKLPERGRNHHGVAFGIAAEQIEGRGRGPRAITSVERRRLCVAIRIVGG